MSLTLLSLLLLILTLSASAAHLKCEIGKTDVYRYETLVDAFGGPKGDNSNEKIEEFTLTATAAFTCIKKFKSKENDDEYSHLIVFNMQHAAIRLKTDAKWDAVQDGPDGEIAQKNADNEYDPIVREIESKLLEGTTYFIQSENGKIYKVYHAKDEMPIVTNLKKNIIQELQTKVKGDSRVENTTEGVVKGHYNRAAGDDGTIFLERTVNTADVLQDAHKPRNGKHNGQEQHRRIQEDSTIALTPDGRVKEAISEKTILLGQHSKRRHEAYKTLKDKINYEEGMHAPTIGDYFTATTKSALIFLEQMDLSDTLKEIEVQIENAEIDAALQGELSEEDDVSPEDNDFIKATVSDNLKEATLLADDDLFTALDDMHREKLRRTTNLKELFSTLHENHRSIHRRQIENPDEDLSNEEYSQEKMDIVARAQHFCVYLQKDCLEIANQYFDAITDLNAEENHSISHVLQSIMVATQTKEGQEALMNSMKNAHLTRHGILRTLDINKPSKKLLLKLKELADGVGIPEDADDMDVQLIRDNAYMALADAASRVHPKKGLDIVQQVINNMLKTEDVDDLVFHIHALGNAGENVPVDALRKLITSPKMGDRVKDAAINALRKHTSEHTDREVTNILHNVLSHPRMHPLLKSRAVKTLAERHIVMAPRKRHSGAEEDDDVGQATSTAKFLERFLYDPTVDDAFKKNILEYYYEEGSDESGELLANFFSGRGRPIYTEERLYDEDLAFYGEDNDLLLRRVGRVVRRIGRAISRTARAVGRVVNTVVQGAAQIAQLPGKIANVVSSFKKVFQAAKFKGQQVCSVVNTAGSRLCMYDQDMISFLQKQGDLSKMKFSRQFSFEKLLGTEGLHAYVGGLGYAGARIECGDANTSSQLDISIFARVNSYARILDKKVDLITGELELNKFTNRDVVDRVYLKVFKSVLVNKSIIPENVRKFINRCDQGVRKSLVYKDYPNLVSIEIIIPIIVPISLRVGVAAKMGVDFEYTICPGQLKVSAGLQPFFGIGVTGGAGISIFVASGHLTLTATFDYRLKPSVGVENCQLCAKLDHEATPLSLAIGGSLKFLAWSWNKKFVEWKSASVKGNLYKYCLDIKKIIKPRTTTPAVATTKPVVKAVSAPVTAVVSKPVVKATIAPVTTATVVRPIAVKPAAAVVLRDDDMMDDDDMASNIGFWKTVFENADIDEVLYCTN